MSDHNNLDSFVERINESEFTMNKDMKEKILSKTYNKISIETKEKKNISQVKRNKISIFSVKNIAAACLTIFIVTAIIPNSPVNALYQKIFSFIPGVGVVQNESEDGIVKSALNEPVKVTDNDEFLEVKSAYIANNTLSVSINTNIGTSRIENIKDKKEVLKYFSGETMPGVYLMVKGEKVKLKNYSTGSPSLETKAYNIKGYFYLDENTPDDALFQISIDGFDKAANFKLSPVKNGMTPESMGSTITVKGITIFANTDRSDGILSVDLSTVALKILKGIRFYLFDHEKALFPDSIYILDKDGIRYQPDEDLRKLKNSGVHTFYFRIPDDREVSKIVFPQILYSRDYDSEIRINMPKVDKAININKEIELGESKLRIENASIVSKNDSLLPEEFKNFDCLRIDYSTGYKNESNEKILRIIPDIQVPDAMTGYRSPSSGIHSELCPLDKNEGYSITEFEDMDKTKKIMINLGIEFAIIGPFEMDINE